MADRFYPILGEAKLFKLNTLSDKPKLNHWYVDAAANGSSIDLRLTQFGSLQRIDACSIKALDELEKLIPHKIDRDNQSNNAFTRMFNGSFVFQKSSKLYDLRRKYILNILSTNFCSTHIETILNAIDTKIDQIEVGDHVNFNDILKMTSFSIMCKILFGSDFEENKPNGLYINPETFEESYLGFDEMYYKISRDELRFYTGTVGNLLPTLAYNNLINPFRTSQKNINEARRVILEFCRNSSDKKSIFNVLKSRSSAEFKESDEVNQDWISDEECVMDAMLMLFAGYDSVSYSIISLLYQLKMNPSKLEKLKMALEESRIFEVDKLELNERKDAYQNWDYLYYCIKEGLRIDCPTLGSLFYRTLDKITICGVPIEKGEIVTKNTLYPHYNPAYYHKPFEFIPERFDPDSKYFSVPGSKSPRDPKWYNPFGVGLRNCVGQTLAKLESKVILSRLITRIDFDLDQDIAANEFMRFNLVQDSVLRGRITYKN